MSPCVFVLEFLSGALVQLQGNKGSLLPESAAPAAGCTVWNIFQLSLPAKIRHFLYFPIGGNLKVALHSGTCDSPHTVCHHSPNRWQMILLINYGNFVLSFSGNLLSFLANCSLYFWGKYLYVLWLKVSSIKINIAAGPRTTFALVSHFLWKINLVTSIIEQQK